MSVRYPTPNATADTDAMLTRRCRTVVEGGVMRGIHSLTPEQALRLNLVGALVRQSDAGLRVDLGRFMVERTGGENTRATPVEYPRGYASPYLFVMWDYQVAIAAGTHLRGPRGCA